MTSRSSLTSHRYEYWYHNGEKKREERRKERRGGGRGAGSGSGGNIRMSTSRDCLYQMKLKKRTVCATPAVYETMSRQPSGRSDIE